MIITSSSLSKKPTVQKEWKVYTSLSPQQTFEKLNTNQKGLSSQEVANRLLLFGSNRLKQTSTTGWQILARQLKTPFNYILFVAALVSLILGSLEDAIAITVFILINASLGFYQEHKSDNMLKLLRGYLHSYSKVIRDNGIVMSISNEQLVPGDIVLLQPGDIIPCDIRLLETTEFTIDESVLTGESIPIIKSEKQSEHAITSTHHASNIAFAGTTVMKGKSTGVIIASGEKTEYGKLASHAANLEEIGVFEKDLASLSRFILELVVITLVLIYVINILLKGVGNVNVVELAIFSIALGVGVIPEALPVVTTFSFTKGALKLAKNKVVIKKLSAIEDLGNIEVLCTDKTGTLTENKLTLSAMCGKENVLASYFVAGNDFVNQKKEPIDPFDIAIWNTLNDSQKKTLEEMTTVSYLPFTPVSKRSETIVESQGEKIEIFRGAWETIWKLAKPQDAMEKQKFITWANEQNNLGRRLLGVASKKGSGKLILTGGLAFTDEVKKTAAEAIATANHLGTRIVILTGDSKEVAGKVALQLGIIPKETEVITGEQFDALSSREKQKAASSCSVFARVDPFQKNEIIDMIQTEHVVGFLGDGINDTIALKSADVGIVVSTASEVAKDAADIILLKKDLHVIVEGIKEGRIISANIRKYLTATLSSNFGNFYAMAVASLLINYLPMLPIQILLVNLLSDFPMISISVDSVDKAETRHPTRFNLRNIVMLSTFLGIVSTLFDFIFFAIYKSGPPQVLYTNWFIGSILTELALIYSVRTKKLFFQGKAPALPLTLLTVGAAIVTILLPFLPISQKVFEFIQPTNNMLYLNFFLIIGYFLTTELVKRIYFTRVEHQPQTT